MSNYYNICRIKPYIVLLLSFNDYKELKMLQGVWHATYWIRKLTTTNVSSQISDVYGDTILSIITSVPENGKISYIKGSFL